MNSTVVEEIPEVNTGDPAALVDFTTWAMTSYPAERYALIIWDHGGSWLGVATDNSADNDDLTLPELGLDSGVNVVKTPGTQGNLNDSGKQDDE